MTMIPTRSFLLGLAGSLLFASAVGCGDSDSDSSTGGGGGSTTATSSATTSTTSATTTASTTGGMGGSGGTGGGPELPTLDSQKVGNPLWEPVDYHQFSVELGDGFANFGTITAALLPPPNHVDHPDLGVGPGAAHAGPYDDEFAAGVLAEGYLDKKSYPQAEGLLPFGVMSVFMIVPSAGAPTGSSPDSASGPIIPNTVFPIVVTVGAYQDDMELDGYGFGFEVPPLDDALDPPFTVDGHSHFPMFNAVVFDGMSAIPGTIETRIQMTDANGDGWNLTYSSNAL